MNTDKKRRLFISFAVISAVLLMVPYSGIAGDSEGHLTTAKLYELYEKEYANGRYQEAIKYLTRIMLIDPSDEKARTLMVQALTDRGILEKSEEIEPGADERDLKAKQMTEEEPAGKPMPADAPDKEEALKYHYNLALAYDLNHRYKEAVWEYKKALEIAPDDADTHYNLGIVYDDHIKDREKAIFHYHKYLELCPDAEDAATVEEWISRAQEDLEWDKKLGLR